MFRRDAWGDRISNEGLDGEGRLAVIWIEGKGDLVFFVDAIRRDEIKIAIDLGGEIKLHPVICPIKEGAVLLDWLKQWLDRPVAFLDILIIDARFSGWEHAAVKIKGDAILFGH